MVNWRTKHKSNIFKSSKVKVPHSNKSADCSQSNGMEPNFLKAFHTAATSGFVKSIASCFAMFKNCFSACFTFGLVGLGIYVLISRGRHRDGDFKHPGKLVHCSSPSQY